MKNRLKLHYSLILLFAFLAVLGAIKMLTMSPGITPISTYNLFLWVHIIVSSCFMILACWHLKLNYGNFKNAFEKIKNASKASSTLFWFSIVVFPCGVLAAIFIYTGVGHTAISNIHRNMGIVMIIFLFIHIYKRLKWFKTIKGK